MEWKKYCMFLGLVNANDHQVTYLRECTIINCATCLHEHIVTPIDQPKKDSRNLTLFFVRLASQIIHNVCARVFTSFNGFSNQTAYD